METGREFLSQRRAEEVAAAACARSPGERALHREMAQIFADCIEELALEDDSAAPKK